MMRRVGWRLLGDYVSIFYFFTYLLVSKFLDCFKCEILLAFYILGYLLPGHLFGVRLIFKICKLTYK
jgi:hypothetical protein